MSPGAGGCSISSEVPLIMPDGLRDLLARRALEVVPRILGLEDREPASPTYGCFDRPYWCYRTADFPSAWFQWGFYLLALAWRLEVPQNIFFQEDNVKEWAQAGIRFLLRSMRRDGSLDEVYPYERSLCATAFAGVYLIESARILGIDLPREAFKIAEFLRVQRPQDASNQEAAATFVLWGFSRLGGGNALHQAAERRLEHLLGRQTSEGAFPEYGGPDVGYQSLTMALLSRLAEMGGEALQPALQRGIRFLGGELREDGSFDPRRTSRGNMMLYPSGLARLEAPVLDRVERGIRGGLLPVPAWLDDRYAAPLAIDYLEAAMELTRGC